jgi:hypothetical protein
MSALIDELLCLMLSIGRRTGLFDIPREMELTGRNLDI